MANNRVILIAGEAIKKEFELQSSGPVYAGMFVMPVAGGVSLPTANYTSQIAILDFTSADGMNARLGEAGAVGYVQGDQVPILYPTAGCEINAMTNVAAIVDGNLISIAASGYASVTEEPEDAIGIARGVSTLIDGSDNLYRIKVEVFK